MNEEKVVTLIKQFKEDVDQYLENVTVTVIGTDKDTKELVDFEVI